MSYDPNQPYGGQPSDPYGQPANPYGQPPSSGSPYNQPSSGSPYDQPGSGAPYGQPGSGAPYGQPPANPTAPLPNDPYANPSAGAYGNPSAGAYGADPYAQPADPYAQPAGAYGAPGGFPPPTPPKKKNTGVIVGGIIAVAVIIIAVCSIGGWLVANSDTNETSASSKPTAPSATTLPSQGASASPSATGPSIDTSRPEVAPAGAPFTTRVPKGFQEVVTPSSDNTGGAPDHTAAMAKSAGEADDLLVVDSYTLKIDSTSVSDAALQNEYDGLVKQIGQDATTRQNVNYNGYRGFRYEFKFDFANAYSYFLLYKNQQIQVRCQWADQEADIKTGCEYLLKNLQITG
ncbi:hypothetical protein [Cryptosporangium arvum]|uniref:hypothetical protein n=1 Tax=Cryptosporangium arvum TaxID=80871 RepID=UPI0004B7D557|nr:hypothetical protein [Cryptosporangium arvum]